LLFLKINLKKEEGGAQEEKRIGIVFPDFGGVMKILGKPVTIQELNKIAADTFGDLVKAVADIGKELIAIDAELHSDLEALLLEDGSKQEDLWGINFYPSLDEGDFIEFDSMINMRPSCGNKSRGVDDKKTQQKIVEVINKWVVR